jgi:signal transduction histidine kinase
MNEIICPKCKTAFKVDEAGFADILKQVRDHQFEEELQKTLLELQASKESLTKSLEKEKEVNDLKSRFVSMASHEFRTPLSTILSSISLMAKYETTEDQPKRDKHIDRIKSSVKILTDILNEFLSLGKIEEGKVEVNFESFDLKIFVQGLINEMKVLLKNYLHLIRIKNHIIL